MMSKKDYKLIADILRVNKSRKDIIADCLYEFKQDNARFDDMRFLKAVKGDVE